MQLIEVFDELDFENPKLATAVRALADLQPDFEASRQGDVLAGHLMGLARCFRSDESAILAMFQKVQGGTSTKAKREKPKQKVKFKSPRKASKPYDHDADCLDCGPSGRPLSEPAANKADIEAGHPKIKIRPVPTLETGGLIEMEDIQKAKSWRDILNGFMGDEDLMLEFVKLHGVKYDKTKKVDSSILAKAIYKHLVNEGIY